MKRKTTCILLAIVLFATFLPGMASAAPSQPFTLEAPQNLRAELKYDIDGVPYFELKLDVPQSVVRINNALLNDPEYYPGFACSEIKIQFDYKYGEYGWNEGESYYWDTSAYLADFIGDGHYDYYAFGDELPDGSLRIEEEVYQFRAYFFSEWGYVGDWIDKKVVSGFSNVVTIGNPAYYSGASDWAVGELDKALRYGFITERIRDNMKADITREEFAEVVVKAYEKYAGKEASYTDMSVFTDTKNPEIFKAYELKIVNGIGQSKYAPNDFITREQMAAMLYRLVNAIAPETDFSTEGAPVFADEADISGYAIENVKFMSKHGFINGIGGNCFGPRQSCTREMAVAVAVRVFEKYTGNTN